jgi:hypothetical protein
MVYLWFKNRSGGQRYAKKTRSRPVVLSHFTGFTTPVFVVIMRACSSSWAFAVGAGDVRAVGAGAGAGCG